MSGAEARWNAVRSLLRARRDDPPLVVASRDGDAPASFGQERLWFLDRLHPHRAAYNLGVVYRLAGLLAVPLLERSLAELVERHAALRTTLHMHDGLLVQRVGAPAVLELEVCNVCASDVEAWAAAAAAVPFELERGPLLRLALARVGPLDHCLLLVVHHAVFDAWSFEVFTRELCALYDAHSEGRGSSPALPALRYADFADWQRQRFDAGARRALLEYWKAQLSGDPPLLRLPSDRPRPSHSRVGASCEMALDRELTDRLRSLAVRQGATLYTVLLAAFQALLHRYTGEEDVIVGSPVAGRNRAELDGVVGLFTNTVPLRVRVDGDTTFRQLLVRAQEAATGAFAHQDLPFELLVKELRPRRHPDGGPLFEVLFALQNIPRVEPRMSGVSVEMRNLSPPAAKVELALTMQETAEGARALAEYDSELFDASTIAKLLDQLATLLDGAAADPDRRIGSLPLLSPHGQRQSLAQWSDTTTAYPRDLAIHRVFEAQVRRAPEAVALVDEHESLSYDSINRRANRLARHLTRLALDPESRIGVCLDRGSSLIVAQLAILKAGLAYVPIDPALPRARAEQLLTRVAAVVTDAGHAARVATTSQVLVGDPRLVAERDDDLDGDVAAERLAYVMFTSGSTGAPRGVCIPHRAVVRLVCGAGYTSFGPDEVFLQLAPASFDAATFEIWGALLNGGRLALAPARPLAIAEIGALVRRHGVTTLWLTSGLFEPFVDGGLERLPSLRQLLSGGDVMSVQHAKRFLQQMPRCRLINGYGPTENTTFTCTHVVERVEPGRSIPIGRAIANTTVYVLDEQLQPVPDGVVGELFAGGDGLARGYLDDDAATRERFVASPFVAGERLYRTGDRVRRRSDGSLELLGRLDAQLKLRGFRIEPAEVEEVLRQCPGILAAAVIADGRPPGDKRLVAYVVARRLDGEPAEAARAFVRSRLPEYMVPSELVVVDRLPLTASGKVDRRALPRPQREAVSAPLPPRDPLERTLVALVAKALDGRTVGIHDGFFDVGGDSLSAVRLAVEIEHEIGMALPLALLFEKPTVAQLADELRRRRPSVAPRSPLVAIKEGRTARPLFLMAGGRGGKPELGIYAKLLSRLAADETVYGLTAPPHSDTVEEIAAAHIVSLRSLQQRGPYRIGGECVGGVVAYEMARQLSASGEAVALLLLIDSWCPTDAGVLYHNLLGHPLDLAKLGVGFLADLRRRAPAAGPWWTELWQRAVIPRDAKRYSKACMRYRPRPYGGALTLLASDANLRRGIARDWQRLAAGGVTIRRTPGNHQTYARQHAGEAAEQLRSCLEERAE